MLKFSFRAATVALVLAAASLTGASQANATGLGAAARNFGGTPAAKFIAERKPVMAPFAHVLFCKQYPRECAANGRSAVVEASGKSLALLNEVNRQVNRSIRPKNDAPGALGDKWALAPKQGDCEDFAITKRHRLLAAGLPASALRLAVAYTPSGEGHMVLVVRTSDGDLVLDNRTSRIKSWRETGLSWVKIQSASNPRKWFQV